MSEPDLRGVLAERLFTPRERWDWVYVPGEPERPSPIPHRPLWVEPDPLDLFYEHESLRTVQVVWAAFLGLFAALVLVSAVERSGTFQLLFLLFLLSGFCFLHLRKRRDEIRRRARNAECWRAEQWAAYEDADRKWAIAVSNWEAEERARVMWLPVPLVSGAPRVDVFGGTPDGWAALLVTVGSCALSAGHKVVVLDCTEQEIGGDLAQLASVAGHPVSSRQLPLDLSSTDLLEGLEAEEIGELLAEAVHSSRRADQSDIGLAPLDADLIRDIAERLDGRITFSRLAAGFEVLQQAYKTGGSAAPLSEDEVERISSHVDFIGRGDRIQNEIQLLRSHLKLLTTPPAPPESHVPLWRRNG